MYLFIHGLDCSILGCIVLWADTAISAEHTASIFSVQKGRQHTLRKAHKTSRCHNPEDHNLNNHCRESLKPYINGLCNTYVSISDYIIGLALNGNTTGE
jgi:hypothetical protein